jgi:hypothetical protein
MFAAHVSPGLLGTQRVVLAENTPVPGNNENGFVEALYVAGLSDRDEV